MALVMLPASYEQCRNQRRCLKQQAVVEGCSRLQLNHRGGGKLGHRRQQALQPLEHPYPYPARQQQRRPQPRSTLMTV